VIIYDYDAGVDPGHNPLGKYFNFIGLSGINSASSGDYYVFDRPTQEGWRDPYFINADVCWFQFSTLKTRCIRLSEDNKKYLFWGPSNISTKDGMIAWTFEREDFKYNVYPEINVLDLSNGKFVVPFQCYNCALTGYGFNSEGVVYYYHKKDIADMMVYYNFNNNEAKQFSTDMCAFNPTVTLFVYNNIVEYYGGSVDGKIADAYYKYDLITEKIKPIPEIINFTTVDILGPKLLITNDTTVQTYDLVTEKIEMVDENANPWVARFCTENIYLWNEVVHGGEKLVLYDSQNKVKRYISDYVSSYGEFCSGVHAVVTPDGSNLVSRMYHIDLDKAGFVKDGHVVPE
jgi:hypothetical protein